MSSTTCVSVPARRASRSAAVAAVYATATAITFSAVSAAPTPIYRFYREALGLTPFTITLIFAAYSFTMIAAFLTIARLSDYVRSEEHTSELQSHLNLVCRLLLEKKK